MGAVEWALVLALSNGGVWDTEFRYGTYKDCHNATMLANLLSECRRSDGQKTLKSCVDTFTTDAKPMCLPVKD